MRTVSCCCAQGGPESDMMPARAKRGGARGMDMAALSEGRMGRETMKGTAPYPIELEEDKVRFLEQVMAKHHLPDVGKTVRCLINYARENPDKHEAIFDE